MSDFIYASGDTVSVLKAIATVAQKINDDFEMLASDCENSDPIYGCLINSDGCLMLNCPLSKE